MHICLSSCMRPFAVDPFRRQWLNYTKEYSIIIHSLQKHGGHKYYQLPSLLFCQTFNLKQTHNTHNALKDRWFRNIGGSSCKASSNTTKLLNLRVFLLLWWELKRQLKTGHMEVRNPDIKRSCLGAGLKGGRTDVRHWTNWWRIQKQK